MYLCSCYSKLLSVYLCNCYYKLLYIIYITLVETFAEIKKNNNCTERLSDLKIKCNPPQEIPTIGKYECKAKLHIHKRPI